MKMNGGCLSYDEATDLRDQAAAPILSRIERDRLRGPARLAPLVAHIRTHLFDLELSVGGMRRACACRDTGIATVFHRAFGQPPRAYIEAHRLEVAKMLLRSSDLMIGEISGLIGFASGTVFARAFRRAHGETASHFRSRAPKLAGSRRTSGSDPTDGARANRLRAEGMWLLLRRQPPADQVSLVRGLAIDLPALFEVLREKSRTEGRRDRRHGVEIAEVALAAVELERPTSSAHLDLRIRAYAWLGNARRLAMDLAGAERALARAERLKNEGRAGDLANSELDLFRAGLLLSRDRLDEADNFGSQAVYRLRRTPFVSEQVDALLLRAFVRLVRGLPPEAILDLKEALPLIELVEDDYRAVAAYQLLIQAQIDTGEYQRAAETLAEAREQPSHLLSNDAETMFQWAKGRIAMGLGDHTLAARTLMSVAASFLDLGHSHHAGCAMLDQALLHLTRSNPTRARLAAQEALQLFNGLGLPSKARRALDLLLRAIQRQPDREDALKHLRIRFENAIRLSLGATRESGT